MYRIGDKVLLNNTWKTKFNQDAYIGLLTMAEVQNNGEYMLVMTMSQTPTTCITPPLSKNGNNFHYGAVYCRQ